MLCVAIRMTRNYIKKKFKFSIKLPIYVHSLINVPSLSTQLIVSHLIGCVYFVEGNTSLKHNVIIFVIMFHVCRCYAVLSVPCSLVITCWGRADLLTLVWCFFFGLV